jgi:hypothetical protein
VPGAPVYVYGVPSFPHIIHPPVVVVKVAPLPPDVVFIILPIVPDAVLKDPV